MLQILKQIEISNGYDVWSSDLENIELSDDSKRAILVIPLMHYGPNKKGLFWTEEMLQKVKVILEKLS